jgi:hypothetical protein
MLKLLTCTSVATGNFEDLSGAMIRRRLIIRPTVLYLSPVTATTQDAAVCCGYAFRLRDLH